VNLPPGHLKTSLGSVCLPAWLLANDPSLKIIIISHTEHLSKTIARNNRSIIQCAWYKELFTTRIKMGHAEMTDSAPRQVAAYSSLRFKPASPVDAPI
jgi:hypothetical protein